MNQRQPTDHCVEKTSHLIDQNNQNILILISKAHWYSNSKSIEEPYQKHLS